jgi:phage internal scaffolding protein
MAVISKLLGAYRPHARVRVKFPNPSLVKQAMQNECDINNIMHRFEKTGMLNHLNEHHGDYGDFIDYNSYHASMNQILEAQAAFASIPAKIRAQFQNDPSIFLQFAQDPKNLDQMVEMGLAPHPDRATSGEQIPEKVATPPSPETSPPEAPESASD